MRSHRRPSPALVIALIALFVGLSSGAFAGVRLNGTQLVNRSVPGTKLVKDSVTGTEIKESRLGVVPRATNATLLGGRPASAFLPVASKAADADKLDGIDSTGFLASGAKAADADKLDGIDSTGFLASGAKAADADLLDGADGGTYAQTAAVLYAKTANGVGNDLGCAGGTLAVAIRNGRGAAVDTRFTFQVPGPAPAYGQIRSDGSVRSSSANVTTVDHTTGSGTYCIHFNVVIGATELESAVAAIHDN